MRRHYLVRKGGSLLVCKLDSQEICKSRSDRVREIFQYLKAPRNAKRGSESGRRKVKYFRFSSGRKIPNFDIKGRRETATVEKAKHLVVQPKDQPMGKVLSFEDRRIRYGRSLMRKRKNRWNWKYNPALESDFNVERFGKDEGVYVDKVNDGKEDEEDDFYDNYDRLRYLSFNKSGKRVYLISLAEDRPFGSNYFKDLFQKALNCSESDAINHALWSDCSSNSDYVLVHLTEEEADGFAGLEEVEFVTPAWVSS